MVCCCHETGLKPVLFCFKHTFSYFLKFWHTSSVFKILCHTFSGTFFHTFMLYFFLALGTHSCTFFTFPTFSHDFSSFAYFLAISTLSHTFLTVGKLSHTFSAFVTLSYAFSCSSKLSQLLVHFLILYQLVALLGIP